jgi:signal transduction histidine kinase
MLMAGARYQKPSLAAGSRVVLDDGDAEICVDEMKMVTVFMNLIGNALKYSDDQIRLTWHSDRDCLRVAVMDQGVKGRGISRIQADTLFVAFGRLDIHAEVEGTGLGLLSVRRIVEVHGGKVFVEGYEDGTPNSARFTTAKDTCPSLLTGGFRTAFIIVCPLTTECKQPLV